MTPKTIQRPASPQDTNDTRRPSFARLNSLASTVDSLISASPTRKRTLRPPKPCQRLQTQDGPMPTALSRPRGSRTHSGASSRPRSQSAPSMTRDGHSRLTKTGRVSRALKGLAVHNCTMCGKNYSRAEHLRRHQLSHNEPTLTCPLPGCAKPFFRDDLLSRHIEEHRPSSRSPTQLNSLYPPMTISTTSSGTANSSNNSSQTYLGVPQNTPLERGYSPGQRTLSEPPTTGASTPNPYYASHMLPPTSNGSNWPDSLYTWHSQSMNPTSTYSTTASPTFTSPTFGQLPTGTVHSPLSRTSSYDYKSPTIGLPNLNLETSTSGFDMSYNGSSNNNNSNNIPSTHSDLSFASYVTTAPYQDALYTSALNSLDPALEQGVLGQPRSMHDLGYFSSSLEESESRAFQEGV